MDKALLIGCIIVAALLLGTCAALTPSPDDRNSNWFERDRYNIGTPP